MNAIINYKTCLFIITRINNAFYKDFAIIYIIC